MKSLLTITAVVEAGTGLGLVIVTTRIAQLLLGAPLNAPAALTVARVAGAALLALGVACWLARENGRVLVVTMLFYNVVAVAILAYAALAYAALGHPLTGIGLWPAIGLHTALAVWCAAALKTTRRPLTTSNP